MDAAASIRSVRLRAGISLRALAERAGTSHSTLAAYESGRVVPRVDTLARILRAAGFASTITFERRADATSKQRVAKGRELEAALELAAMFPAAPAEQNTFPPFAPAFERAAL